MATVVLTEKPSVARDIARVLGANKRGQGHVEGNGYIVTWALGHLVQFAEPDDYGPPWNSRWSFAQLPMIPEQWKLKTARSTSDQYQIVKKLLNSPQTERVICATDAGREGEHIFRLIYEHARCKKPFSRLWVSSLTDEAIRGGFHALQEGAAFDHLAAAARARGQADWLMGMNLTRAYTVHNKALCTIGRVQTPTLSMVVKRDAAIASFVKAYFYELVAQLEEGFAAKYCKDGQTRIDKKEEAERLHRQLSPNKVGTVRKIEKKVKKNRPPPLYDLNNLQRDANRCFGFTAAQTLERAQALYETHKLITYPRTESRHISEDMVPKLPGILEKLAHPQAAVALERLRGGHRLSRAYVDRTKLTDHHAIIPTGQQPAPNLAPDLQKVYDLVVARFVGIFLPDQQVEETTVLLDIGGADFVAKGSVVLEAGWTVVAIRPPNATKSKEKDDDQRALPPLQQGQQVHVTSNGCGRKGNQAAATLHRRHAPSCYEKRRPRNRGRRVSCGHEGIGARHASHAGRDYRKADSHRLCSPRPQGDHLDGEGQSTRRLGGRIAAQPRADGRVGAATQGNRGRAAAGGGVLRRDRRPSEDAGAQGPAGTGTLARAGGASTRQAEGAAVKAAARC